ncbi:MAG: phenylalanine--tRNA ligase subunit beta [Spirochaetia bacterium]|nr:phenylalanine--tRNA ligase subunit beta [Spirochaetia bacterium]MCF7940116.1 phenylalanine--tRNA ligase subunit beta [Spirochaetia bacterium]
MPKIEVHTGRFFELLGDTYTDDQLEEILPAAKAELDGRDDEQGILKIELNDTNRPDLWSAAGLARQLRVNQGAQAPFYDFFSTDLEQFECEDRVVEVDQSTTGIRPYIVAFAVSGKAVDEASLKDLIQTQEKLCWNFGRKRRSIAMGVYRSDLITYPVQYAAVDPDTTSFIPLQMDLPMTLRQILKDHPKGQEFGHIVADLPRFPFLQDANGQVLSFPPVINSAEIGAVQIGDEQLFIELTGTVLKDLILAASIVSCDLADQGFTILPVKVVYPYETEFGREIVCPYYFQEPVSADLSYVNSLLGEELSADQSLEALRRMGIYAIADEQKLFVTIPEYRNDFLHPVDVVEDVMIGHGLGRFEPVMPRDYTVGRLTSAELFARKVKDIMIGLGFQEMMYNYLGSRKDYIEKMHVDGAEYIQIANPMTENYEYVRASIMPSLLNSESVSGNAVYPHRIFEVGKVAFLEPSDNSGTVTRNALGFFSSDSAIGFNEINSELAALLFYLNRAYSLREVQDPRFIEGRAGEIIIDGVRVGIFGEVHPAVLESWGIGMPSVMCEMDLDLVMAL